MRRLARLNPESRRLAAQVLRKRSALEKQQYREWQALQERLGEELTRLAAERKRCKAD
jgi:hypothetical protein